MITFQSSDSDKYLQSSLKSYRRLLENAERGVSFTGWLSLPEEAIWANEARRWAKEKGKFKKLAVLGIGGSSLGARAVLEALGLSEKVKFFENVDGHAFVEDLAKLDWAQTHFVATSKSGNTLEALCQLGVVLGELKKKDLKFSKHVTIISERKKSPLTDLAELNDITVYDVPPQVGGRFSVLCNVGLLPLAWAGVNVDDLLKGADWVKSQDELIACVCNSCLHSLDREEWITVFWIYVERLRAWGLWLEQLWAESLAKRTTRSGTTAPRMSTPITAIGTTDQHSLLQQFMEGAGDKYFMFIRCKQSEQSAPLPKGILPSFQLLEGKSLGQLLAIEAQATQEALEHNKRHTSLLTFENADEKNIGALLFLFEAVVGTLGECLDINAFDQPGVELGKKLMLAQLGDPRYRNVPLLR